jgi:RimJ/RimL family protein N-acetyltransferase
MKDAIDESIEHLLTFMPWAANEPQTVDEKIQLIRSFRGRFDKNEDFVYGVFSADESVALGGTGLHTRLGKDAREIGYWIRRTGTHQGYATEVSAALTKVAFEVDQVNRVEIHCAVENYASAAVPRRLGYTLEATLRKRTLLLDNRLHDTMIWTLHKDDYPSTPCGQAIVEAYDAMGRRII